MLLHQLFENSLPMDAASRMKRAKELGFTVRAYHGTNAEFNEFDIEKGKAHHSGFAPHFTDDESEATGYAKSRNDGRRDNVRVMSVLLRIRKPFVVGRLFDTNKTIAPEIYKLVTGGHLPDKSRRERYMTAHNAIEHAMDVHYDETGNYNRKAIWTKIYDRLKKAGYDAIIWEDTPSDYSNNANYTKIVMLDMTGIRLETAAFDPAMSNSPSLTA